MDHRKSIIILLTISVGSFACIGSVKPKKINNCSKIHGMPGPEDMAIHRANKTLYVSSHNRRNFQKEDGFIFTLDLSKPLAERKPVKMSGKMPANFKPHGISLIPSEKGGTLYVISHPQMNEKHTIEVFDVDGNTLTHKKTHEHESLTSPNDLVALTDGTIFVSNDHGKGGPFRQKMDDLFGMKRAKIAFYDGKNWHSLDPALTLGNGIYYRMENGKNYLYRAGFMKGTVYKYEVSTGKTPPVLSEVSAFDLESGVDNIEPDSKGNLLIVAHKSVYRFLRHAGNAANPSPTQVFRLNSDNKVEEIYADTGEEISAGSTAIEADGFLYISQVFEDFILACPVP